MSDANTEPAPEDIQEPESPGEDENTESSVEDEASTESAPFLEAVRAPIREDAPAGDDVLYAENFQELKTEINKISSAGGTADYEQITELARTILTEQSKDLRAAGYLVVGAARAHGTDEAAEAVRAVHILIQDYWDELHPESSRMRSRGNALQFISDRLPDWLQAASFEPEDRSALDTIHGALDDIQTFTMGEMGEHAPSLSGLLHDLEDHVEDLPVPEPEDSEPEDSPDESSPKEDSESASASAPSAESMSVTESDQAGGGMVEADVSSETEAEQAIHTVAGYYRDDDLTSPIPYRLLRAVRWGSLQSAPPNDGGTTRFEAPREQRRDYLEGLLEEEDYETLVREGESSFQSGTFHVWLDLQRLIATAQEALGESYRAAREVVLVDVAMLVDRVPGLLSLTFQDGTPFASARTVDWIETEAKSHLGDGRGASGGSPAGQELSEVESDHDDAREELKAGNLENALSILLTENGQDRSRKETFHRQLHAASLCLKAEKPAVARPILDDLASVINDHALDVWVPSLALEVWTNRCRCYDRLAEETDSEEETNALRAEAENAFEKICRVDPAQAVTVDGRRPIS
jgi:type VI secretion system protein VasJ